VIINAAQKLCIQEKQQLNTKRNVLKIQKIKHVRPVAIKYIIKTKMGLNGGSIEVVR
jgi:hypothetical protein